MVCVCVFSHSVVSDSTASWTVAHQPPLSEGCLRQEYWSELPFPSPHKTHIFHEYVLENPWTYLSLSTCWPTTSFLQGLGRCGALRISLCRVWGLLGETTKETWGATCWLFSANGSEDQINRPVTLLDSGTELHGKKTFFICFKYLWRRKWQPTPVFLPGKCHNGQRGPAGYSPMRL